MSALDAFGPRIWADPTATGLGRIPMRATAYPFPDEATARSGERDASPWFLSLDGTWRFRLLDRPEAVTTDLVAAGADHTSAEWHDITVPGCWTVQPAGLPDRPHYTNVVYPFGTEPPEVPSANPTGVYRTTFRLPRGWAKRRTLLRLGGAESLAAVWVDGRPVGFGKDSRLPIELDLTPHLAGPCTPSPWWW